MTIDHCSENFMKSRGGRATGTQDSEFMKGLWTWSNNALQYEDLPVWCVCEYVWWCESDVDNVHASTIDGLMCVCMCGDVTVM